MVSPRWFAGIVLIIGAAFVLRIYHLDTSPLRGDEAFAVQYWAASPTDVIPELADREPHPLGTFITFWAWKQLAGSSAFAIRYLPLLGSLLGAAAVVALGKRLFRDNTIALVAVALWAVNPFLIWHAQDARNYALWAGLSAVAMWLFIRAIDRGRPRDWLLYTIAEIAALYMFFLEPLLLAVQAGYLLTIGRSRRAVTSALAAWTAMILFLIPWMVQAWYLSRSGYEGTLGRGEPDQLLTWFLPTLLVGDTHHARWDIVFPAAWCALIVLHFGFSQSRAKLTWLIAFAVIPSSAVLIASMDMSVFHPRYVIAIAPALLLLTAHTLRISPQRPFRTAFYTLSATVLIGMLLVSASTLSTYYRGENPKAYDWPPVAAYLSQRANAADLILKPLPDPAFNYYYTGQAAEKSLAPGISLSAQLIADLNFYSTIWFLGNDPDVNAFLNDRMQQLHQVTVGPTLITQYRAWKVEPTEIQTPTEVSFADVARLAGFALTGPDETSSSMSLVLYWVPMKQTQPDYKVFVHLRGPLDPATGAGPIRDQDDRRPRDGFASTQIWEVGSLVRDPYQLLSAPGSQLEPGQYIVEVGIYDPADGSRLPLTTAESASTQDRVQLAAFTWPPP